MCKLCEKNKENLLKNDFWCVVPKDEKNEFSVISIHHLIDFRNISYEEWIFLRRIILHLGAKEKTERFLITVGADNDSSHVIASLQAPGFVITDMDEKPSFTLQHFSRDEEGWIETLQIVKDLLNNRKMISFLVM